MKPTHKLEPLPEIPHKRYFAIGEVSELCGLKAHVLRYWEQEFPQLRPAKRRGNRRYYQHDDVEMIRRIRSLLYEQGYTIGAARLRLKEQGRGGIADEIPNAVVVNLPIVPAHVMANPMKTPGLGVPKRAPAVIAAKQKELRDIRNELESLLSRWPV